MLHLSVIQYQWWRQGILPLFFYTLGIILMATPGDIQYKPIPKEPPWPPICQMAPDRMPCDLIY